MFDESVPGPDALHDADDATVVAAIAGWARVEAAAAAQRRLAAIAELVKRRPDENGEQAHWARDAWDSAAAEVAAAQTISHRAASAQMHQAVALRDRLPRVAALFMAGDTSHRLASTVAWRTQLIVEDELLDLGPAFGDEARTGRRSHRRATRRGRTAALPECGTRPGRPDRCPR